MTGFYRWRAYVLAASAIALASCASTYRPPVPIPTPVPPPVVTCAPATPIPSSARTTSLKTANGYYVTAEGGGCGAFTATRTSVSEWETFAIEQAPDGRIALRTHDGHYVTAELGGGGGLSANRTTRSAWETFTPVPVGDGWAILTADGKHYLRAELGGGQAVNAAGPDASAWQTFLASAPLRGPPPATIDGRIRTAQGRFLNDAGWLQVRSISEFSFVHLARTGRLDELQRRIDRAATAQRNMVRVFARARNLFSLDASMPGYWEACDLVVARANAAGLYVEFVLGVDATGVEMREFIRSFVSRYASNPGVTFQLSNEPWQNGWERATDPELIDFAEMVAGILGHRDFSIGDPRDGDDEDASKETTAEQVTLAKHCNIIVLHPSRQGGADFGTDGRFRRWIDHVEGFSDTMDAVRAVNPNAAGHIDEKMGHASVRWVPIPGRPPYERDPDPEAALAGALTAHMVGADTYHYISEQDDGTPGLDLIARIAPLLPTDPSWHYRNDSNGGATKGFSGWGKVRTWTNGQDAIVLANGQHKGSVTWANGFHPVETLFDGEHVTVWRATR